MIITSIECQEKNKKRYDIFIDQKYSFSADYDEIVEFNIKVNAELTEDELEDILYRLQYKKALSKAFYILNIKSRTQQEIENKLKSLDFDQSIIAKVLERLKELGYLNDLDFSRQWIYTSMSIKPVGKRKLSASLRAKGVDQSVIDNAIESSGYNDLDTAIELVNKKLRTSGKGMETEEDKGKAFAKLYRYLLYRGIDYDTAKKAINSCINSHIDE